MVKRLAMFVVCLLLIGSVLGCASTTTVPTYVPTPVPSPSEADMPNAQSPSDVVLSSRESQVVEVPGVEARLVNVSWISPGEVEVGNYYPSARAEWNIRIHNGSDSMARFSVTYRVPDNPKEGYDTPPKEAQNWVIISDTSPLLSAKETREILIALVVPEGTNLDSKRWEFWISMVEGGQGLVQTEMCQRWLIQMK